MKEINLSAWALKHPSLIWFLMAALLLGGVQAFFSLGQAEDPKITIKTMVVRTLWPGATAVEVEHQVTDLLEIKLQETPYLDYLTSYSKPGESMIFLQLQSSIPAAEVPVALYQVRKKLRDVRDTLPQGVLGPYPNDEFGDTFGTIYAFTTDGIGHALLRDYVDGVRQELLRVPHVAKVELLGVQEEKIFSEFSNVKLSSLGLSPTLIIQTLQGRNYVTPSGVVETRDDQVHLRVSGLESEQAIRDLGIRANGRIFRLGDITEVFRDYVDPPVFKMRFQGEEAIGLAVSMSEGGNVLALGEALDETMTRLEADLPIGIQIHKVADQPAVVKHSVGEFLTALSEAVAIVLFVSFLSLGMRTGLVVALSIPLVLAVTFLGMKILGVDLQRISLGALIISLGLLVDDAMIAIEMMAVKLEQGWDRFQAATFAYTSTAFPMLTGTAITVAAFSPVSFAESGAGEYTRSIFTVVGLALAVSWLVAVLFIPFLGYRLLPARAEPKPKAEAPEDMEKDLYKVVFDGTFRPGAGAEDAIAYLVRKFRVRESKARRLMLDGKTHVLKQNVDAVKAERYRRALTKGGLLVQVEPMESVEDIARKSKKGRMVDHRFTPDDDLQDVYTSPFYQGFRRLVQWCVRRRWLVIFLALALFAAAMGGFRFVEQSFFPVADREELIVDLWLPQGASFAATEREAIRLEAILQDDPQVESYVGYVGGGSPRFYLPLAQELRHRNLAQYVVMTSDPAARFEVAARLEKAMELEFPGLRGRAQPLFNGPPVKYPVEFRVIGKDRRELRHIAARVADLVRADPATRQVHMDWNEMDKVVRLSIDQDKARILGISTQELAVSLNAVLDGHSITRLRERNRSIEVLSRATAEERIALENIGDLSIPTTDGRFVPLDQLVTLSYGLEEGIIWRRDGLPTITVRADVAAGVQPPDVSHRIAQELHELGAGLPPGYRIEMGGTAEVSAQDEEPIAAVFPIMILAVFTLLMIQLQSLQRALLVFFTAPLGLIGVVAALLAFGAPFGFVAMLGVIALFGMIVRNAVILVDQIEQDRANGAELREAIVEATVRRLRPIALTAATAVLAMIPLSMSFFWGPMAISIMGGLLVATVLTLLFLPALYAAWFRAAK